jgi:nucleoside-diphosphate-sugar epimerase
MTIRWITQLLGTAAANDARNYTGVRIVDVRELVDKAGNRPDSVRQKIMEGVRYLESHERTIVCCDYGISRSNAIAAGILAVHDKRSLDSAIRVVQRATGEQEIKLEPLNAVRRAIEPANIKNRPGGKRTVLVTGASGFIGRATCKRLAAEFNVIAPSRMQLDIAQGNTQLDLFAREHAVNCIVHLANPRIYTSNIALGESLSMLRNVLSVCASQDTLLLYPSGWEVYSGYSGSLVVDESVAPLPRGPYGEAKYLSELLIEHWQRTTNLRCVVLRSSPVYGAGADKPKFIYNFMDKARNSLPIITHRYLNGDPSLDLLHIDDFVDAILRAIRQEYVGTLNIGTGITTSTPQVAEILKAELGSGSRIEYTQLDASTASISMNYRKAFEVLGWRPAILLQDGLRTLVANIASAEITDKG